MALNYLLRRTREPDDFLERRVEPRLGPTPDAASEVFDSGRRTVVDCAHVRVERLDTRPVLFSKVFKEFEDRKGQKYDYRYWAERENYFLREFLKKQSLYTHVVQARHLISENEAAKQVLTCDAGVTVANWLRVKARYADTATLSNPFQRSDAFLRLIRACLVALKQIHQQRIVHCDIKEDNICIPYAPNPFPARERRIHIEFEKLKLIDFAFSVAHAIPLTQILVINPDERVPYQSELLIAALRADRQSGSPDAVQQLDYRVDLFSLGYMAGKISAVGLDCPVGPGGSEALQGIHELVQKLKDIDKAPAGPLPHDDLIAEIDRLLVAVSVPGKLAESPQFHVDGEWSSSDMARGGGAGRKTPSTPVALPPPTPVAAPMAPPAQRRARAVGTRYGLAVGLALSFALGGAYLSWEGRGAGASMKPAQEQDAATHARDRVLAMLRSDDDTVFKSGLVELAQLAKAGKPAADAVTQSITSELAEALAAAGPRAARSRSLGRLIAMAKSGSKSASQHLADFERGYDEVKATVAKSAWWARGQGEAPAVAARWMDNGELLAEHGDRPAMLDRAFAVGHGRAPTQDRVLAAQTYLKVIDQAGGADEYSARLRQSAVRGLSALLNTIVMQRDQDAAKRVFPAIAAKAEAGAAGFSYYLGLINECVARPANLDAARQWYLLAAADPAWKRTAEDKARLIGRWCPGS
jgi:hypothetical protein